MNLFEGRGREGLTMGSSVGASERDLWWLRSAVELWRVPMLEVVADRALLVGHLSSAITNRRGQGSGACRGSVIPNNFQRDKESQRERWQRPLGTRFTIFSA